MMSIIRLLLLFSVKLVLGDENVEITRINLSCVCLQHNVNILLERQTDEISTLLNFYMQGLVLIHVVLE